MTRIELRKLAVRCLRAIETNENEDLTRLKIEVRVPEGYVVAVKGAVTSRSIPYTTAPAAQFDLPARTIVLHPQLAADRAPSFVIHYLVRHEVLHYLYPPLNEADSHHEKLVLMDRQTPKREVARIWLRKHGFPVLRR